MRRPHRMSEKAKGKMKEAAGAIPAMRTRRPKDKPNRGSLRQERKRRRRRGPAESRPKPRKRRGSETSRRARTRGCWETWATPCRDVKGAPLTRRAGARSSSGPSSCTYHRTSRVRSSKKFVPSTVRGVPGSLAQTSAELFCTLLCPLSRRLYLRLLDALLAVGTVPEFQELLAGLGVQNGLHRFFDGLPTPLRPGLGLAHQDLVGHLRDALILAHGALLLAQNFTWGE